MKDWRDIRKNYKATEMAGIIGIVLCFLVGAALIGVLVMEIS